MSTCPKPPNGKPRTSSETDQDYSYMLLLLRLLRVSWFQPSLGKGSRPKWASIFIHDSNLFIWIFRIRICFPPLYMVTSTLTALCTLTKGLSQWTILVQKTLQSHLIHIWTILFDILGRKYRRWLRQEHANIYCQCCTDHNIVHFSCILHFQFLWHCRIIVSRWLCFYAYECTIELDIYSLMGLSWRIE